MYLTKEEAKRIRKVRLRRRKVRLLKILFKEFWKEWGISLEELGMLIGAIGCILFPVIIRIILAFFGI